MNIDKLSTKSILERIATLEERVSGYEDELTLIKSQIYVLYVRHLISKTKTEIHKLEAELEWRKNNERK